MKILSYFTFDEDTSTVSIYSAKYNTLLMKIKVESSAKSTISRIEEMYDSDNYWMASKPSDETVFQHNLFDKKKLIIHNIDYELK